MAERLLRMPEVTARTGLCRSRIYDLEKRGEFPSRRQISERAVGWLESEVTAFIESRPIASNAVKAAAV